MKQSRCKPYIINIEIEISENFFIYIFKDSILKLKQICKVDPDPDPDPCIYDKNWKIYI